MGIINAIFQAIIQGLTEFLPVSSSGHLSLYQHFTGNSGEGALFFSAILHLGTLVAEENLRVNNAGLRVSWRASPFNR